MLHDYPPLPLLGPNTSPGIKVSLLGVSSLFLHPVTLDPVSELNRPF
jgi:hypothetical protein